MRNQNQNLGGSRARRWFRYLWHEWIGERWRPIAPAFARPNPAEWSDNRITAAWLGHATVLINFFGIKILTDPVTAEEEISLSEIIKAFNDRHGTQFTKDFLRFEQVNHEIMDEDMVEMLRNNPPDVVFSAFSRAFFKGAIRMFQRDAEMKEHRPRRRYGARPGHPALLRPGASRGAGRPGFLKVTGTRKMVRRSA